MCYQDSFYEPRKIQDIHNEVLHYESSQIKFPSCVGKLLVNQQQQGEVQDLYTVDSWCSMFQEWLLVFKHKWTEHVEAICKDLLHAVAWRGASAL